ncbi:MAG: DUF192 domain-containing protein, partial [Cyanobacteria bacterium P01_D01_bin.56]
MNQWRKRRYFPLLGLCCLLLACSDVSSADDTASSDLATDPVVTEPAAVDPASMLTGPGQVLPITARTTLAGEAFDLEVAQTAAQQQLGLMHRKALPDNRGMLFPFSPARPVAFWMKNVP